MTWDALLQDAAVAGIPVHERSLAAGEVQAALVSGRYLAIALVDKCTLGLGPPQSWADAVSPDAPGEVAYVGEAPLQNTICNNNRMSPMLLVRRSGCRISPRPHTPLCCVPQGVSLPHIKKPWPVQEFSSDFYV